MRLDKLKEPYVIILIGPPLSGKTTWIRQNFGSSSFELISRDEIVLDLHGNADYNTAFKTVDQKEVDRILVNKILASAKEKKNVIIDMTNMNSKRRKYNLSFFDDEYYKLSVIFPILKDEEYVARDKKRTEEENKSIPMSVIKNMISSYQPVSKEEGFNSVISAKF
jgi:predicted kinase